MTEMFSVDNLIMFSIILFSSFFVFLFVRMIIKTIKENWWLVYLVVYQYGNVGNRIYFSRSRI